jgi:hypothetical protein
MKAQHLLSRAEAVTTVLLSLAAGLVGLLSVAVFVALTVASLQDRPTHPGWAGTFALFAIAAPASAFVTWQVDRRVPLDSYSIARHVAIVVLAVSFMLAVVLVAQARAF